MNVNLREKGNRKWEKTQGQGVSQIVVVSAIAWVIIIYDRHLQSALLSNMTLRTFIHLYL